MSSSLAPNNPDKKKSITQTNDSAIAEIIKQTLTPDFERWKLVQKVGRIGIFDWELSTNKIYWSPEEEAIFGLRPGEFKGDYQDWSKNIHPDDKERVENEVQKSVLEGSEFNSEFRVVHPDGSLHWLVERGNLIYSENGRAERMIGITMDITERRQTENSLRFLSEASQILSSSLEYEKTFRNIAELAVPFIADWCAIDMIDDKGEVDLIAVAHVNPKKVEWARRLRLKNPVDMSRDTGLSKVLKTGEAEYYPVITEEMVEASTADEEELEIVRELGLKSVMIVPLSINERVIGAISFISSESKRVFSEADFDIALQLANRASSAIDNANLYLRVQEERKRLDNVVANVPGVVWEAWGQPDVKHQRIDFVSDYVEKMLGYTKEEWLETPNFWLKIVHPDDKKRAALEAKKIFESGTYGRSEFRWVKKSGEAIWVEAQSSVIQDSSGSPLGMRGVTMDITDRKQAELYSKQLAAIVESTDDAVIGKSLDGTITSWNKGAEKLYGFTAKEAIGKPISLHTPLSKLEDAYEMLEVIKLNQPVEHFETQRCRKDGTIVDVSITMSPIHDEFGRVIGAAGIDRDISANKELERRKDAFISMASHELKTPVTTIQVFNQLLLRQAKDNPEAEKYLDKMQGQINNLNVLINDLLDLSRIQTGKLELVKERFSIDSLVREMVENIQASTNRHKIILKGRVNNKIYGDSNRLSQVFVNLLTNAIKYSPNADQVVVEIKKQKNNVAISVQDFGIGIAKEHQDKIFDRFYRVEGLDEKTFPGLGIGLYISAEIIRRHGGRIWLESERGEGTTFHTSIPLK